MKNNLSKWAYQGLHGCAKIPTGLFCKRIVFVVLIAGLFVIWSTDGSADGNQVKKRDADKDGIIDQVEIHNHAIAYTQIVDDYNLLADTPIEDEGVCIADIYAVNVDLSGPEGDPDCVVDIYDFVEMASGWLSSGLYPVISRTW